MKANANCRRQISVLIGFGLEDYEKLKSSGRIDKTVVTDLGDVVEVIILHPPLIGVATDDVQTER